MGGTRKDCLFCGKEILTGSGSNAGYYFESSDGSQAGFLENDCFLRLLSSAVFNMKGELRKDDPTFMLLVESARKSFFAFRVIDDSGENKVDFRRLDFSGNVLTSRILNLKKNVGGIFSNEKCPLFTFISETLSGYDNSFRDAFVLVQPVNQENPEEILLKEQYKGFNTMKAKAAAAFT